MDHANLSELAVSDFDGCPDSAVIRLTDGSILIVRADQTVLSVEPDGAIHLLPAQFH